MPSWVSNILEAGPFKAVKSNTKLPESLFPCKTYIKLNTGFPLKRLTLEDSGGFFTKNAFFTSIPLAIPIFLIVAIIFDNSLLGVELILYLLSSSIASKLS